MIYSILLIPFAIQLLCPEKMLDFTEWWYEKKGMTIDRSILQVQMIAVLDRAVTKSTAHVQVEGSRVDVLRADEDLFGIQLRGNNLSGWNFVDQNLSEAAFSAARLTGANFTGAVVAGAAFDNAIGFFFHIKCNCMLINNFS